MPGSSTPDKGTILLEAGKILLTAVLAAGLTGAANTCYDRQEKERLRAQAVLDSSSVMTERYMTTLVEGYGALQARLGIYQQYKLTPDPDTSAVLDAFLRAADSITTRTDATRSRESSVWRQRNRLLATRLCAYYGPEVSRYFADTVGWYLNELGTRVYRAGLEQQVALADSMRRRMPPLDSLSAFVDTVTDRVQTLTYRLDQLGRAKPVSEPDPRCAHLLLVTEPKPSEPPRASSPTRR